VFRKIKQEELKVPASFDYLKDLREFVTRIGKKYRFSQRIINPLKLAVDEASTNIIRHAYKGKRGSITIRAHIRRDSLTISLIDQGRYFDPNQFQDPDIRRYVAAGRRGGLGIFMIRRLVDRMDYQRTDEGNELRLTKLVKAAKRRSRLAVPRPRATLRVKFYTYSAITLSFIVILGYFYYFFQQRHRILKDTFQQGRNICAILVRNSTDLLLENILENRDKSLDLSREANVIVAENKDLISFAVIEDLEGVVKGSTEPDRFPFWKAFNPGRKLAQVAENVTLIQTPTGEHFYDVSLPIEAGPAQARERIGKAHIFIRKDLVDGWIWKRRLKDLQFALLILVAGNAGIVLLITLIISPFRKLADWVRALGQGEPQEEMEIDASDEIGEIARAFSEITDKFRKTQETLAEQERIQQEMELAREIQQTLLPSEFPSIKGYDLSAYYEAAKEVGGDYFDFVEVGEDRYGIVVADVSGKGVPGSLVMTMIRTAIRTEARGEESAAEVLRKVNDFVAEDMKKGMFVTLFYAILDARRRRVCFASAGHNPMILYRASTKKTYYLNPRGFPIGISLSEPDLFKRSIEDDTIQLTKGDLILIYTDGITEAMNRRRDMFGEERLLQVVRQYGHLPADEFIQKLRQEILSFTEGQPQHDDITLVVVKESMSAEEVEFERAKEAFYSIINGESITDACRKARIPVTTFNRKYRVHFEQIGVENFRKDYEATSVEAKHLSIEEQTKIYDIIRQHPEYGPRKISEELNTEKYGFTKISESRIYEELVRKRLNTRALREAYVARSAHRKHLKPPGTPLMTLDGRVIIREELEAPEASVKPEPAIAPEREERILISKAPPGEEEVPSEITKAEDVMQELRGKVEELLEMGEERKKKLAEEKPLVEEEAEEFVLSDLVDLFDREKKVKELIKPSEEEVGEPLEADQKAEAGDQIGQKDKELTSSVEEIIRVSEQAEEGGGKEGDEEVTFEGLPSSASVEGELESLSQLPGETQQVRKEQPVEEELEEIERSLALDSESVEAGKSEQEEISFEELSVSGVAGELESIREGGDGELDTPAEVDSEGSKAALLAGAEEEVPAEEQSEEEVRRSVERFFESLEVSGIVGQFQEPQREVKETEPLEEFEPVLESEVRVEDELRLTGVSESKQEEAPADRIPEQKPKKELEFSLKRILLRGIKYYKQKDYDKAIAIFEKVVETYPDCTEGYYNLGNAYFRRRMFDKAKGAYQKVIELNPQFLDAYENLAAVYANEGEYQRAIQMWKEVLIVDPQRIDIKRNIEAALRLLRRRE